MASMAGKADYDSDEELMPKKVTNVPETAAEAEPEEDTSINNSDVLSKYQDCAKISNEVIAFVSGLCVPGAKVFDICKAGDDLIISLTSAVYRNKVKGRTIEKGVAFPVCVSVNECICHMSPLASEEPIVLAAGDLVKIDMGVHIDGYITLAANTVIVGHAAAVAAGAEPVTGRLADVFHAAWTCAEVAARMVQPGADNRSVTAAMKKICDHYGVNALEGNIMHQVKRYVIDGSKNINVDSQQDTAKDQKTEKCTFEAGEIWALDICLSTGDGKRKERNTRTTVFKRIVDGKYCLKIASSRKFLNEVNAKFPSLPFSLRMCDDETTAKMGVRECATHELVTPYSVAYESTDAQLVHVKYTVLLTNTGNVKVTGLELPPNVVSERTASLPDDLKELLATVSIEKKKKNRGKGGKK